MAQATPDAPKLKDCPVCDGKGYLLCDCWPGDCICGYGDETCEECSGYGFIDPDDDYGYYEGFQQMTPPLTPEAVAQMERQLRAFGGASDVGVMDSEMAHEAADMLTTLAAENATLRAERDAARKIADHDTALWLASETVVATLRASEAAALEALAEIGVVVAALEGKDSLDREMIRNIGTRIAALTPTSDKEPKT